jgi:hypothetical protein
MDRNGRREKNWCCQTGLNCRPLHYQWSALPLSYGSMLRTRESAQKDPYRAGRSLPQAPCMRKRGRGRSGPQKRPKSARNRHGALKGPVAARFGSRFLPKGAAGRGLLYLCMGLFSRFFVRGPEETPWWQARTSKLPPPRSSVYCSCGRSPVPQVHDDG